MFFVPYQANKKTSAKELGAQSPHCMTFWRGLNTLPSLPILLLLRRLQIDTIGIDLTFVYRGFDHHQEPIRNGLRSSLSVWTGANLPWG